MQSTSSDSPLIWITPFSSTASSKNSPSVVTPKLVSPQGDGGGKPHQSRRGAILTNSRSWIWRLKMIPPRPTRSPRRPKLPLTPANNGMSLLCEPSRHAANCLPAQETVVGEFNPKAKIFRIRASFQRHKPLHPALSTNHDRSASLGDQSDFLR